MTRTDGPDDEDTRSSRVQHGMESLKGCRREWDDDLKRFRDNPVKDWAEHIRLSWRYLGSLGRKQFPTPRPRPSRRKNAYQAVPGDSIRTNMTVKEAVDAMVRRRRNSR